MEELVSFEQAKEKAMQNKIVVDVEKSAMVNSKIRFTGVNNILFIEDGTCIKNSAINFAGNNSVVYLCTSKMAYFIDISIFNSSVVFIGRGNYFNPARSLVIIAAEQQNVIIGEGGLFSHGIYVRTTDPHLLYDNRTKKRLNPSKSILIGDHVWLGQNTLILKGTCIGSGAVIGGDTVLAGKQVPSNTVFGGNPDRIIREKVFFSPECVNSWTSEMTEKYKTMDSDEYIYHAETQTITFEQIDTKLKRSNTVDQRIKNVQKLFCDNKEKNRFAIKDVKKQPWEFWK